MKLIFFLLFFIITIECIQSQKQQVVRTYTVVPDNVMKSDQLISYTVYDSSKTKFLYKLKSSSAHDIDTIEVISSAGKNMVANLEGEWVEKIFNVTYAIYDYKLNKWIDEFIYKNSTMFSDVYKTRWNSINLHTKTGVFSKTIRVYATSQNKLFGEIRKRSSWSGDINFEVKIYSNECPPVIYFFIMAINDHRKQIKKLGR